MLLACGIRLVEQGFVPDPLVRIAIRRLCSQRLREVSAAQSLAFLQTLRTGPIALVPEKANAQHYEVPAEFFELVLGPHRKYSCCLWLDGTVNLAEAEVQALETTCERAELRDGHSILELGCGWGSLTLWMAERYPSSQILAVSNSSSQRKFIESTARDRGLHNVRVVTADMNGFEPLSPEGSPLRFDRVVSVEMFEHMHNFDRLLSRIASWLLPGGKLFVHHFCHRSLAYPFDDEGEANWMGQYFFSGGLMPTVDLLGNFPNALRVTQHWAWDGTHYAKTAEAWLNNQDRERSRIFPILRSVYGADEAVRWFNRWRIFFLSVAELFNYAAGQEWFVSHTLLESAQAAGSVSN